MLRLLILLSVPLAAADRVQRQNQGFVQVTDSDKVAVQLQCAPKFMHVILSLNQGPFYDYISIGHFGDRPECRFKVQLQCAPKFMHVILSLNQGPFYDYISIGHFGDRPECRFKGNGSTLYELQIHLMGDRCGTEMVADTGTFENVIRIGAHPTVVLDSDERVVVRCLYGPPKVDQPHLPPLLPAQPQRIVTSTRPPLQRERDAGEEVSLGIAQEHIILIVFLVLILALIFLLCGCLYFFFKRRKVLVEKRNKLLVPVAQNNNKMDLWWPTASSKAGVSNDALLSHDYMISSNSTREQLSVSVESPEGTGSTNTGTHSSPEHEGGQNKQVYMHESKHMIPRAHGDMPVGRLVHSLQSIPEERLKRRKEETPVSYAKIEKREEHTEQILTVHNVTARNELDETKITEIYRAPSEHNKIDNESISTLEGIAPGPHVHALEYQKGTGSDSQLFVRAIDTNRGYGPHRLTDLDVSRWKEYLSKDADLRSAVYKARTLEDFESITRKSPYNKYFSKEKWSIIAQSLAHVAFMRKLSNIIDNQTDGRPDNLQLQDIDTQPVKAVDRSRLATIDGLAAELRQKDQRLFTRDSYAKVKDQYSPIPETEQQQYRTKFDSMRTVSSFGNTNDRSTTELAEPIPTIARNRAGPTGTLPKRHFRERSSSETFENPPQLSVYLGNVSNRDIRESVNTEPDLYNAVPGFAVSSSDHLPSPPEGF